VTYAPALNDANTLDDDSTASARASLAAFVNGQTGVNNPQRQGLNSAVLATATPSTVLRWNPGQGRYSRSGTFISQHGPTRPSPPASHTSERLWHGPGPGRSRIHYRPRRLSLRRFRVHCELPDH